jgi:hypothetical protein
VTVSSKSHQEGEQQEGKMEGKEKGIYLRLIYKENRIN